MKTAQPSASPCQRVLSLVSSAPERAALLPDALTAHVERCAACQVEVLASLRLTDALRQHAAEVVLSAPADAIAARAIEAAAAGKAPARKGEAPSPWLWALPAAAAAVAVVAWWPSSAPPSAPPPAGPAAPSAGVTPPPAPSPGPSPTPTVAGLRAVTCERLDASGAAAVMACPEGSRLTTSVAERARIVLSDGTTLWLDRATTVELAADRQRALRVPSGQILLDVVRQGALPPLDVDVPTGHVQVVGTKLQVSAQPQVAVVDVLRGTVLASAAGKTETLRAGDEAVLLQGEAPRLQAAGDLGAATAWAEAADPEAGASSSGFGTLKARRPGAKEDSEQALRLVEHRVDVRVQGRLARTEIEEAFTNDTDHTLEGTYRFPLPAGARIAALELLVDDEWEHGAVVARDRGDKIWRGVIRNATPKLKRKTTVVEEWIWIPGPWKDPALLKWSAGNAFELRIFPIDKRSTRKVRIAYTQVLAPIPGGRRYVYPLPAEPTGGARAERFAFEAQVGGLPTGMALRVGPYAVASEHAGDNATVRLTRDRFVPEGDLVLDVPDAAPARELTTWAYQTPAGDASYAAVALRPRLPARGTGEALNVLFVVDASYSVQAARLARAAELVARATAELSSEDRVHVLTCATRCRTVSPGFRPAGEATARDLEQRLSRVEALGSTRLGHAFERAAATLKAEGVSLDQARVIYVGDGVPSVGELEPARLSKAAAAALPGARLTTVSLGGSVDDAMMRALASAGSGAYVAHGAGDSLRATAFRVLQRQWGEPLRDVELALPAGMSDLAPAALGDLWPGEERLVAARLQGAVEGDVVLRGTLHGEPFERTWAVALEPTSAGGNAFLPRLWAERRIDDLQQREGDAARDRIVELSKRHHVLSRHTSLIVLESEAMAKAFDVADTRPAVEWTGEEGATAVAAGEDADADADATVASRATADGKLSAILDNGSASRDDAFAGPGLAPFGDSGSIGSVQGGGGGGSFDLSKKGKSAEKRPTKKTSGGTAGLMAPPRPRTERPQVRASSAKVSGSLDRNVVRRVLRRHTGRLRAAYERTLMRNPSVQGRAVVRFTILPSGKVAAPSVSGISDAGLRSDLVRAFEQMRFPAPGNGGTVTISYPLVFRPGDAIASGGRRRGPGAWRRVRKKKVWYREASVARYVGPNRHDTKALDQRRQQHAENPESRDRTRDLVRAYLRSGDLESAETVAKRWLVKDRLDAGALVALSDLAALRGEDLRSRELLASAVDVDPRAATAHTRMMGLYRSAGDDALRCEHALTRALVAPADWKAQAAAVRCGGERPRLLERLAKRDRRRADKALASPEKGPRRGDQLVLDATWEHGADLDLVVVTPRGRVISWRGGAKRVAAHDALAVDRERLVASVDKTGRHRIFVVQRDAGEAPRSVSGTVRVRAHGETRRLPFTTVGGVAGVGEVVVASKWRWEQF